MQKTLGGDRLGSGKKMKVELHGYERSTHDLGYVWRSTMSAGTLVPFMNEIALPGDTFDIDLNCDIKTHPTIGPLFGSYKVQLDVFQAPIRLYNSLLHNNALGIGLNMEKVLFPTISLPAVPLDATRTDIDNAQINPSCLLHYLGIKGVGYIPGVLGDGQLRDFNAIPLLAYWEIYKNYYANKQEEKGAVIHTPIATLVETIDLFNVDINNVVTPLAEAPTITSITIPTNELPPIQITFTGATPLASTIIINTLQHGDITLEDLLIDITETAGELNGIFDSPRWGHTTLRNWRYRQTTDMHNEKPVVEIFELANIDAMRKTILAYYSESIPFSVANPIDAGITPYKHLVDSTQNTPYMLNTQEGLGLKTYQSDLFNNWLQTEWIDGTNGINQITAIDTSSGEFTIDTLNLAKKVYDMLNRIAVSGGSYDDWLDAVYTHDRYTRCESPMYMGGLSKELVFQEVVSNTGQGDQPLGTLAGKGVMAGKHKGGKVVVKVDEPSYIMGIISLTPRIDYSQGNKWDVHLKSMDDLHKPALDEIGFQELITEQLAWWDTTWDDVNSLWVQKSAGKQPAWINYMTNVNQTHGNFAIPTSQMFMTLNRRYEKDNNLFTDNIGIQDLTTYIDPAKFNHIFAQTSRDAQNFWAQISVDITARRKMSAKIMPNL